MRDDSQKHCTDLSERFRACLSGHAVIFFSTGLCNYCPQHRRRGRTYGGGRVSLRRSCGAVTYVIREAFIYCSANEHEYPLAACSTGILPGPRKVLGRVLLDIFGRHSKPPANRLRSGLGMREREPERCVYFRGPNRSRVISDSTKYKAAVAACCDSCPCVRTRQQPQHTVEQQRMLGRHGRPQLARSRPFTPPPPRCGNKSYRERQFRQSLGGLPPHEWAARGSTAPVFPAAPSPPSPGFWPCAPPPRCAGSPASAGGTAHP